MPSPSGPSRDAAPAARHWTWPCLVAALAWLAVVSTLDSSGAVPWLGEGPGLTLDETFNVQMGVYHVRMLSEYGLGILSWESIREIFGADVYNPDHPPLGRVLIGAAHEISWPVLHPDVPASSVAVTCGRVAPACGYALTLFLVGWITSRWYGRPAGLIAAVSLVLMPRLFAHAHIAALETLLGLTYIATVFHVAEFWTRDDRPALKTAAVSGVLLGLALLTKIQAILLPIPIALWALWRWRLRSIVPLILLGGVGMAVFFLGWPWLWLDPVAHLSEYLGRTTDRLTLYCWYMGRKWADIDVPWHYPVVMFAVTVPVGLHALGVWGLIARGPRWVKSSEAETSERPSADRNAAILQALTHRSGRDLARQDLIALNVFWPLAFFAIPGITVYDGARLFLMVFPLWGVLIGRGGQLLWGILAARWSSRRAAVVLGVLLGLQAYGTIALHPVQLSYYNLLVGGLRGASRLGFEVTYWGDSLTRSLLSDVRPEWDYGPVYVAPVLHPFQLQELRWQSPELRAQLLPFDEAKAWNVRRLIVFRRRADAWASLSPEPPRSRLRGEVRREGVQLSGSYEIERGAFGEAPPGVLD